MKVFFLMQDTPRLYGAERATIALAAGLEPRSDVVPAFLLIEELRLGSAPGGLSADVEKHGLAVSRLPTNRRFSMGLVRRIRRACDVGEHVVLHCFGSKATLHGALAAKWGRRFPVVTTLHGWLDRSDPKEKLYEKIEAACVRRMPATVVLSRAYEDRMHRLRVDPSRVHRIASGCAPDDIVSSAQARQSPPPGQPFTVGVLARFSEEKNHDLILRAAAQLKRRSIPVQWRLAGGGPLRSRIEIEIQRLSLTDIVRVLPYTAPDEFFPGIHALVVGSRIENLPYCVFETMAWCRPCIATRVGGLPELIEEGATGFLVDSDSPDQMADRVKQLSEDPDLARLLGRNARVKLEREFRLTACVEAHLDLYRKLVGPPIDDG